MNNFNIFGKILRKFSGSKDTEKKSKEEEDLPEQNNIHLDIEFNKEDDFLDKLVMDFKIGGVNIQKYAIN